MRRREFITLIGGAATWPLVARAQGSQKMRRVGVLFGIAESDPLMKDRIKGFRLGMRDLGWIEGRDIQIEYRFAGANLDSIKRSVEELLRFAPDVIVANSTPVLAALQRALFQSYS
jgi:putative ABC transport system substrate-binding protein